MRLQNQTSTTDERLLNILGKYSIFHGARILISFICGLATGILISNPVNFVQIFALIEIISHLMLAWYDIFQQSTHPSHKSVKLKTKAFQIFKCFVWIIAAAALFHIAAVLYGAPIISSFNETFHFGLLVSLLIVLPGCSISGTDTSTWLRISLGSGPQNIWERSFVTVACSTVVGSWLGAFPIPLDWDRPWQVWPISCLCGALLGSSLGWFWVYWSARPKSGPKKRV